MPRPLLASLVLAALAAGGAPAWAQSAERGAMFYMRLPNGSRSCLSCHGADPGANPNNILRGANNPAAITKALTTVGAMGFLNQQLLDADRADIAAGTSAAAQWVRITNVSAHGFGGWMFHARNIEPAC